MPEMSEREVKVRITDYRLLLGVAITAGCLTLTGWIWAIVLTFVPVDEPAPREGSCGSPALFDAVPYGEQLGVDKYPAQQEWVDHCVEEVSRHIRQAVGISVVTAPLAGLWIWSGCTLPRKRAELAAATEG
ncbi:hypothetical protein [Prauserella muralis]|uniref:Uncharacterized protein n=1 Tax=Prauserella muralis TaxID=588067 RepID=A0A2V4B588_9PSEU|nr:hypothetical protein [Prauserella muralis]PXY28235.1 hypothetical protein BAY60_18100 [Prauserella muralis]TWE27401.1 hypothetical protein FHX69_0022 [Prauserella muralis]